jgi:hypothetical protein
MCMNMEDMSGGTGRGMPDYPERWKRERLLWYVHEWIQEQQVGEEFVPELTVTDVQVWGDQQEGLNGVQAVNLFKQLYEEDYFSVNFLDTRSDRYPWYRAAPQALTTKGLLEIGELPDPDQRFITALEEVRRTIERHPDIPPMEKSSMLDTLQKMISMAHDVAGLAQLFFQASGGGPGHGS